MGRRQRRKVVIWLEARIGGFMSDKIRAADLIEEAMAELQLTLRDAEKADAGNISAGVRTRKRMQEVIAKLKQVRKVISEVKQQLKSEKEENK